MVRKTRRSKTKFFTKMANILNSGIGFMESEISKFVHRSVKRSMAVSKKIGKNADRLVNRITRKR